MPSIDEFRQQVMISADAIGHGKFRSCGFRVRDFLDQIQEGDTAHEVGAKLIMHFAVQDGAFNAFVPGVQLAIAFLSHFMKVTATTQGLKDLKLILDDDPSEAVISRWIGSNYQ
jgi:hypothetical protein